MMSSARPTQASAAASGALASATLPGCGHHLAPQIPACCARCIALFVELAMLRIWRLRVSTREALHHDDVSTRKGMLYALMGSEIIDPAKWPQPSSSASSPISRSPNGASSQGSAAGENQNLPRCDPYCAHRLSFRR